MIHQCTFQYMPESVNVADFGKPPAIINPWELLKELLETTGDHFVWVVVPNQLGSFMKKVRDFGLERYLVIRQDGPDQGVTNRNYITVSRKLKLFVMKGEK